MDRVVEIPMGSLVGLCLVVLVLGVVAGRSGWFMKRVGQLHASAHGHAESHADAAATADQRVQTVVMVGSDGVLRTDEDGEQVAGARVIRTGDGRYDLDAWEATSGYRALAGDENPALEPASDTPIETSSTTTVPHRLGSPRPAEGVAVGEGRR